jgi:hypothetical protein
MVAGIAETTSTGVPLARLLMALMIATPGVTLPPQFDIQHHQVVLLASKGRFRIVAGEPLLHGDVPACAERIHSLS